MDPVQLQTQYPVLSRFSEMSPEQYQGELEKLWRTAEEIKATVQRQVEAESITPIEAIRLIAVQTATLFGYVELQTHSFS